MVAASPTMCMKLGIVVAHHSGTTDLPVCYKRVLIV